MARNVPMPPRILYTFHTAPSLFELEMVEKGEGVIAVSLSRREGRSLSLVFLERFEIRSESWTERAAIVIAYLCARPGDKSLPKDYFKSYTNAQLSFCAKHAKPLARVALQELGEL